jgi:hypothetical protein
MPEIFCRKISTILALAVFFAAGSIAPSFAQSPFDQKELGNDHGLTDFSGKELVPTIYADIKYLGHGLFLLKQRLPDPERRFECADEKLLFDSNFRNLKPNVPPDANFERILWLGKQADLELGLPLKELPSDSLLIFNADKKLGICDVAGKQILHADYTLINALAEDVVTLRKSDGDIYAFDFTTRKLQRLVCQNVRSDIRLVFREGLAVFATIPSRGAQSKWGFMNKTGEVVIDPKYDFASPFFEGLACVRFPGVDGPAHNELINKVGKLSSPPGMQVLASFGPKIEVRDTSGNCGIMDHKFQFVIKQT